MQHHTDYIKTADGFRLFTQQWLPETPARAHLVIVHGYAEYSGRYEHVAEFFTSEGIAVHAFDLRGHGHSEGKKGYVDRFELFLKDLTSILDRVKMAAGQKPVFLFGHSMGGAIVTLYAISRQPKNLAGVLLSAPALKVSEEISPLLQRVSGVLGEWLPKVKTIKLDSKAISRDPEVVAAYEADPLIFHEGTYARTGAELIRAGKRIQANMEKFKLPVFIMHGTDDRLTDYNGSKELNRRAGTDDKSLELYNGLYHELLNEPEQKQVMGDMLEWMEQHLDTNSTGAQ